MLVFSKELNDNLISVCNMGRSSDDRQCRTRRDGGEYRTGVCFSSRLPGGGKGNCVGGR